MEPKLLKWKLTITAAVFLSLMAVACFAEGPGFDCGKAKTSVEKLICEDTELSKLDKEMTEAYESLLPRLKGEDKEKVKKNQIRWLEGRDDGCEPGYKKVGIKFCKDLYRERVEELREWKKYVDRKETTLFPPWIKRCWRRRQPYSGADEYITGDAPICRAFEQVLNTTCKKDGKLDCNWTSAPPPGEKRFQKLVWRPLDWRKYWKLIEDIRKKGLDKDTGDWIWKRQEADIRKEFEAGERHLSITEVDIDHEGRPESVVKEGYGPSSDGAQFGVMIPKTKRLDPRYATKTTISNAPFYSEIMLYKGKAFLFGVRSEVMSLFIWDADSEHICRFECRTLDKTGEFTSDKSHPSFCRRVSKMIQHDTFRQCHFVPPDDDPSGSEYVDLDLDGDGIPDMVLVNQGAQESLLTVGLSTGGGYSLSSYGYMRVGRIKGRIYALVSYLELDRLPDGSETKKKGGDMLYRLTKDNAELICDEEDLERR